MKKVPIGGPAKQLEDEVRRVAQAIAEDMPPGFGFTLFVFEVGRESGFLMYISTAKREDMVRSIREWLAKEPPR